jgi:hypothetical protein
MIFLSGIGHRCPASAMPAKKIIANDEVTEDSSRLAEWTGKQPVFFMPP